MNENIEFLQAFLKNPLKVGSIAPSSPELAQKMLDDIRPNEEAIVLELGVGTGAITKFLQEISAEPRILCRHRTRQRFGQIPQEKFSRHENRARQRVRYFFDLSKNRFWQSRLILFAVCLLFHCRTKSASGFYRKLINLWSRAAFFARFNTRTAIIFLRR